MSFEGPLTHPPASVATVDVPLLHHHAQYTAVAENVIAWQAHRGAIALLGWSPVRNDPIRVAFGRILVRPVGTATHAMVAEAATYLRDRLAEEALRAVLLLGGEGSIALWIPFSDAPDYAHVRAWLDELCSAAARERPDLITVAHSVSERGNLVHLAASSNAVGRFSALPYSLEALDALPVQVPITWDELTNINPGDFTAANFADRLKTHGDVFASEAANIGQQPFANREAMPKKLIRESFLIAADPRGRIIRAAIAILDDGKPRDADALYISRAKGHDRTPKLVQDPDRRFRRNLPADDWPAPKRPLPKASPVANAEALIAQLDATGTGDDPAAYELAVCAAFEALGVIATHLGGADAPDGYIDAPLGTLGYRAMLECKRARTIVMEPDAAEAAKYVGPYHAQHAALIGPAFGNDTQLAGELQTHAVAAFTNADLAALLRAAVNPHELRELFAPGFADDKIELLLWEREHGLRKRIAVICDILIDAGWREQYAAAKTGDPADAPRLDEDAAMMLADEELLGRQGSQRPAERPEIRAAFSHLTDPLIAQAAWLDDARSAIAMTQATYAFQRSAGQPRPVDP